MLAGGLRGTTGAAAGGEEAGRSWEASGRLSVPLPSSPTLSAPPSPPSLPPSLPPPRRDDIFFPYFTSGVGGAKLEGSFPINRRHFRVIFRHRCNALQISHSGAVLVSVDAGGGKWLTKGVHQLVHGERPAGPGVRAGCMGGPATCRFQ